jgi:hypothetical protein
MLPLNVINGHTKDDLQLQNNLSLVFSVPRNRKRFEAVITRNTINCRR